MARVYDILVRARDTLSEKTPKRWKTDQLLRSLSECQKKIAQELRCIRSECTIQLCHAHHTYKLDITNIHTSGTALAPSKVINHAGVEARFVTQTIMQEEDAEWRTRQGGDITHIIYDKKNPLYFRVYPIPTTSKIVEIGSTFNTTEDSIDDAATICEVIASPGSFDITAEKTPIKIQMYFFHVPPPIVTVVDTNLLLPQEFDIALKHYVVGMTLRNDLDSQNRSFGIEELKLFDSQYMEAKALTDENFVDQSDEHYASVEYNAQIK